MFEQPAQAPAAETPPDTAPPAPETKPEPRQPLAEVIRQAREEREGRARDRSEISTLQAKLAEAEARASKSQDDPLADPVGWARAKGLDARSQAMLGQSLLYDLAPEKAPPDFRVKLLEAKIAREAAQKETAAAEARDRAKRESDAASLANYKSALTAASKSFEPGSHPETEAWFGGDTSAHVESLANTARNLAEAALARGEQPDLNPANVAKVLETEIARRMTARDERRGKLAPKTTEVTEPVAAPAPAGGKPAGNTTSTRGLTGSGTPRTRAQTEKERVERAIAAAFAKR